MMVQIYDYAGNLTEVPRGGPCELAEALPDPDERAHAEEYLRLVGRYWLGGGAAPIVLLCRANAT